MRIRSSLAVASFLASLSFTGGCSSTADSANGAPTDDGGGDAASTCSGDGKLTIRVHAVPDNAVTRNYDSLLVYGSGLTHYLSPNTETSIVHGEYTAWAAKLLTPERPANSVYVPTISPSSVQVCAEAPATVDVTYAPVPSSGKVWMNSMGGSALILGYASAVLRSSGEPAASVAADTQAGKSVTFDREGNLWTSDETATAPTLVRYSATSLGASGKKTPERRIALKGTTGCNPVAQSLAFDEEGNLWVSSLCEKKVLRVKASDLDASGEIASSVVVSGLASPRGLAFDIEGNLWIADGTIRRYDRRRLADSTDGEADGVLDVGQNSEELAFDTEGNLWSVGSGEVHLLRILKDDLSAAGERTITPSTTISLGTGAHPHGIAFDEDKGLWVATTAGSFGRLAPNQLRNSSTSASPTIAERTITSTDVRSAGSFAIYPAPEQLPLYHRIPQGPIR